MPSRIRRCLLTTLTALAIFASLGCNGLTIGPQVRTEYVILHAGKPLVVLENVKVKGRVMDGAGDAVDQDIGGWVVMPQDHWQTIKAVLEKAGSK